MESVSLWVRCRGRWPEIIGKLAPHQDMLDAIARGPSRHGRCPVHEGAHGDAFRVFENFADSGGAVCNTCGKYGTGFKLLMWINGWDAVRTGREIRRVLEGEPAMSPPPLRSASAPIPKSDAKRPTLARLLELRAEAKPLNHHDAEPVRRYLASRGLGALDLEAFSVLRCHPSLAYYDSTTRQRLGTFPTLLADVVGPAGDLVALHRTYLTSEGHKVPLSPAKKLLVAAGACVRGGAVRLHAAGEILCTCEGLENGLATLLRNRMPLWPALAAPLLGELIVPAHVRHVVTWGDYEPPKAQPDGSWRQPGRDAADKLATRMRAQGRSVESIFPIPKHRNAKRDWNQVLIEEGIEAIPLLSHKIRMLPTAYRLAQLPHATVIRS